MPAFFMLERVLRENKIEIPFPQRVVHVRTAANDAEASAPEDNPFPAGREPPHRPLPALGDD